MAGIASRGRLKGFTQRREDAKAEPRHLQAQTTDMKRTISMGDHDLKACNHISIPKPMTAPTNQPPTPRTEDFDKSIHIDFKATPNDVCLPILEAFKRYKKFAGELESELQQVREDLQSCKEAGIQEANWRIKAENERNSLVASLKVCRDRLNQLLSHFHTINDDTAWTQTEPVPVNELEDAERALSTTTPPPNIIVRTVEEEVEFVKGMPCGCRHHYEVIEIKSGETVARNNLDAIEYALKEGYKFQEVVDETCHRCLRLAELEKQQAAPVDKVSA